LLEKFRETELIPNGKIGGASGGGFKEKQGFNRTGKKDARYNVSYRCVWEAGYDDVPRRRTMEGKRARWERGDQGGRGLRGCNKNLKPSAKKEGHQTCREMFGPREEAIKKD